MRGKCASIEWHDELAETVASSDGANPEMSALYTEVLAAVDELPDAQRVVMLLVAGEGFSYQEAADTLGIPIGTIMSRLARARLTIGQRFNEAHRPAARGARRVASAEIPDTGVR